MSENRQGWFADVDGREAPNDEYRWQPCLQLDGMCLDFDVWFRTRKECEEFIRDDVIGKGWIPGDPIDAPAHRHDRETTAEEADRA